jgi:phenylalanyl-tRNA synthetase beta chain
MKFSEQWLRTFVDPKINAQELANVLTMAGLEVEALESVAPAFSQVVVAQVLKVSKHPDADRLNLCEVNVGEKQPLQIVCGAQNVAAGIKVPCARIGAKLPGIEIKQAKVRGIESFGMLCSARELGLSEDASGLLILAEDAPVGSDIREHLKLDDKLFTLKLTPNRGDCLSILGIAREVAALTNTALEHSGPQKIKTQSDRVVSIDIQDSVSCPRYAGRVIEKINPRSKTPDWMVMRLQRSGVRSISPVVDVTNYVMLELGQPMHAFDLNKLKDKIVVRKAKAGEELALLNDQKIKLDTDMLVIADASQAVALAGIMGGQNTSVDETTTDLFLESAFFSPDAIMGKARRLKLSTDSSYRFERGVDFNITTEAIERATELILEICGGKAGPISDLQKSLPKRAPVAMRLGRAQRVLGIDLGEAKISNILQSLHFAVTKKSDGFHVTAPSYRFDIAIEEDLIEELARVYGYDHIPISAPRAPVKMLPVFENRRGLSDIRKWWVARDYHEVMTFGFVDSQWEKNLADNQNPIKLLNPIAENMSVMRSTLWGGLLDCLRANLNRKQSRVRIFEIGKCFYRDGRDYIQPGKISGLCYGPNFAEQWGTQNRQVDFYDVKADIEALVFSELRFDAAQHPALHPGRSAKIWQGEQFLGWCGELHPQWVQEYGLQHAPILFELELSGVEQCRLAEVKEISKFPLVRRDIAIVVDDKISSQMLIDALGEAKTPWVTELFVFDIYRGTGVPQGKKSLAFAVFMQDTQRTLTDMEIDGVVGQMISILESRYQAKLRT